VRAINAGKVFGYISKPWESLALISAIESAAQLGQMARQKAVLEAQNRAQANALAELNASLERRVRERTEEVEQANARLKRNYMMSIKVFVNLIEMRGDHLVGHGRRVADLARLIATALDCGRNEVETIFVAGLLHDIGQIGLPDHALAQPAMKMDGRQLEQYRRHAALGEQSLMALEDLQPAAALIRAHHERFDGRGYPDGLHGDQIELGARILAVADRYDELLTGERGVGGLDADTVKDLLLRASGSQFDPRVVVALIDATQPVPQLLEPVRPVSVGWSRLEAGMELAADLRSPEGALLLAADQVLSARTAERIREFARREWPRLELQIKSNTIPDEVQ
jgi:response regulator RpfG family c-di-GMP phosphodiesterase